MIALALASVLAVILGLQVCPRLGHTCIAKINVNMCGPGWTRVAFSNVSNGTEQCPRSWVGVTFGEKKLCARQESKGASCDSVFFPTGLEYIQVCGKILGHQFAYIDSFGYRRQPTSIDNSYVDGVHQNIFIDFSQLRVQQDSIMTIANY